MGATTFQIGGHEVELEERTCEGGCGKRFKVLPSSPMRNARRNCQAACKGTTEEAINALNELFNGPTRQGRQKKKKP